MKKMKFYTWQKKLFILTGLLTMIFILAPVNYATGQQTSVYPTKPVTLIVPFAAGGAADILARVMADYVGKKWGNPIIIQNIPGGNSIPAVKQTLESSPDGYTLFTDTHNLAAMMPAVMSNLPFDWEKRTPICLVMVQPVIFMVKADSPFKTLDDVATFLQKNHRGLSTGVSGVTGPSIFSIGQFLGSVNLKYSDIKSVSFPGHAPALTALAGGHIDIFTGFLNESTPLLSAGKLRGLAVSNIANERLKAFPNIPTVAEAGYPNITVTGWWGITGPAGLPQNVINKWNDTMKRAINDPEYLAMASKANLFVTHLGPDDYKSLQKTSFEKYLKLAKELGVRK